MARNAGNGMLIFFSFFVYFLDMFKHNITAHFTAKQWLHALVVVSGQGLLISYII